MEKLVTTTDLREQQTTPSKNQGLGDAVVAKLMTGFWFGVGVI